jgi:hypothetical protein
MSKDMGWIVKDKQCARIVDRADFSSFKYWSGNLG